MSLISAKRKGAGELNSKDRSSGPFRHGAVSGASRLTAGGCRRAFRARIDRNPVRSFPWVPPGCQGGENPERHASESGEALSGALTQDCYWGQALDIKRCRGEGRAGCCRYGDQHDQSAHQCEPVFDVFHFHVSVLRNSVGGSRFPIAQTPVQSATATLLHFPCQLFLYIENSDLCGLPW